MAEIDLEAEYDTRAMVPEHPEILAGWARDAEAYRAEMGARAELGLAYGVSPRQTVDLFAPRVDGPLALFIHGGWWRTFDPSWFSHMARGLNGQGVSVALAGYDLCPQVSIATIVEQIRKRLPVFVAANAASECSSSVIPPAAISPPPWSRRTGRRAARRPIWCRQDMRSRVCSI